jgi:anti-sigma regulatory factor (Ser/Thr protein kinase)
MPDMELALPARAENIAIVRHALGGLGEAYAVPERKLADVRLAVTEACANVVVHAYPEDQEGLMEVVASMDDDRLTVLVRDWGRGINPRPDSPGLGLGLSLIATLAERVQLTRDDEEHTEVRMTFLLGDETASAGPGTSAQACTKAHPDAHGESDAHGEPDTSASQGAYSQPAMNGNRP